MSRRGGDSGGGASHGGGGYSAAPPPISNYKGVMLCDRPVTKGAVTAAKLDTGDSRPWRAVGGTMTKLEPIGLNPSREKRALKIASEHKVQPQAYNNFLSKHLAWLKKLGEDRKRARSEEEDAKRSQSARRRRFQEYNAQLRATIRAAKQGDASQLLTQDALQRHISGSSSSSAAPTPSGQKRGGAGKPAWAMSEAARDAVEDEEVDALLDFASNLDYNSYIDDYEVRQALAVMKSRVSGLKDAASKDEADAKGTVEREDWQKAFAAKWNEDASRPVSARSEAPSIAASEARSVCSTARAGAGAGVPSADALKLNLAAVDGAAGPAASARAPSTARSDMSAAAAERVLSSSRRMRQVHSRQSIRNILGRGGAAPALPAVSEEEPDVGPAMAPPAVQTYDAMDQGAAAATARKGAGGKVDPSNLPYLHRNPAV